MLEQYRLKRLGKKRDKIAKQLSHEVNGLKHMQLKRRLANVKFRIIVMKLAMTTENSIFANSVNLNDTEASNEDRFAFHEEMAARVNPTWNKVIEGPGRFVVEDKHIDVAYEFDEKDQKYYETHNGERVFSTRWLKDNNGNFIVDENGKTKTEIVPRIGINKEEFEKNWKLDNDN